MKKINLLLLFACCSLFLGAQVNKPKKELSKPTVLEGSVQYGILKSQNLLENYKVVYDEALHLKGLKSNNFGTLSVQSGSCAGASPFCADNSTGTTFPATTGNVTSEVGPNYGCLSTQPNPAWYFFQVSQSGSIDIGISGTGNHDVDFICWGPFSSPNGNCGSALTNTVDCSYSPSATETCTITNAIAGQYYMLLITNFSNLAQNINFNQVGGTGSTNCNFFAAVTNTTICSGVTTTVSSNTSLQSPTYSWSPGGETTSTISVTPSVTTIYTLTVSGLNASNTPTSTTNTGTVTVIATPTITLPTTLTACSGSSVNITNTITPVATYSYNWSTGATTSSISVNTTTVVSLTATSSVGGCVSNISTCSITINPNPTITIDPIINLCGTATAVASPTITGGLAPYNYTWTPALSGNTPTATVSSAGANTIVVMDQNLCSSATQFTVTVNNPSVTIIPTPINICGPGTTTLNTTITGATSYSWSNATSTSTTVVNSPGSYTVSVLTNGCIANNTIILTPLPIPTVAISPTVAMCQGTTTSVSIISITPAGAYTYTWSTGSHLPSTSVSSATVVTVQVTNTLTGCISSASNSCTISPTPNPTVSLSSTPVAFCNGGVAILTSSVTSGAPIYNYTWTPTLLGTAATATTGTVGSYTLLVVDQNLCRGTATVATIKSIPSVTVSSPDLVLCPGDCTVLNAIGTSSYAPITYSWTGSASNTSSVIVCYVGTTTVSITDGKGCVASNVITTTRDVIPVASFTASPVSPVSPGQVITFTNTSTIATGSITSNLWSFGDGGTSTVVDPAYSYTNAGTYPITLVITGSNGCKDTASISYIVDAVLLIPNVITPNGDGVNDYLKFNNLQVFSSNTLSVFNRWGKKIFEQENYKNDWNGSGHSDGTYFFILNVPGATPQSYQGYFQMIR